MSERDDGELFIERSWPPARIWGYLGLFAAVIGVPALFIGGDFRVLAVVAIGLTTFVFGFGSLIPAVRHWWIASEELRIDPIPQPVRLMYGFPGRQRVVLNNICHVDTLAGGTRAVERQAFDGRPSVKHALGGSCERFWCKGHVVVRLHETDEYGDTILLSTHRPQEAARILNQAIADAKQRRGTTT